MGRYDIKEPGGSSPHCPGREMEAVGTATSFKSDPLHAEVLTAGNGSGSEDFRSFI